MVMMMMMVDHWPYYHRPFIGIGHRLPERSIINHRPLEHRQMPELIHRSEGDIIINIYWRCILLTSTIVVSFFKDLKVSFWGMWTCCNCFNFYSRPSPTSQCDTAKQCRSPARRGKFKTGVKSTRSCFGQILKIKNIYDVLDIQDPRSSGGFPEQASFSDDRQSMQYRWKRH